MSLLPPEKYFGDEDNYGEDEWNDFQRVRDYILDHDATEGLLSEIDHRVTSDEMLVKIRLYTTTPTEEVKAADAWFDYDQLKELQDILEEDDIEDKEARINQWFTGGSK